MCKFPVHVGMSTPVPITFILFSNYIFRFHGFISPAIPRTYYQAPDILGPWLFQSLCSPVAEVKLSPFNDNIVHQKRPPIPSEIS